MLPKRLHVSKASADALKLLKARTGITPNILCRMALLLSLESGRSKGRRKTDQEGNEFNAPTLFGEFAPIFRALIFEVHGKLDAKETADVIASHIEDGLVHLRKAKTLPELIEHCGARP